jgi:hypothetical protein
MDQRVVEPMAGRRSSRGGRGRESLEEGEVGSAIVVEKGFGSLTSV